MKKFLLISHDEDPDDDRVVGCLRGRGIEPEIRRPFLGEALPALNDSLDQTEAA